MVCECEVVVVEFIVEVDFVFVEGGSSTESLVEVILEGDLVPWRSLKRTAWAVEECA